MWKFCSRACLLGIKYDWFFLSLMGSLSPARLSVVIVTKNRSLELAQCLGSILSNSLLPDEIVVIDNHSTDQTRQLVVGLQLNSKARVVYDSFDGVGYPTVYNRGLELAQGEWVAFIDDDCVADVDWVKAIKSSIRAKTADVIMGWCDTYYPHNVYSQATLLFDSDWKERSLKKTETSGKVETEDEVIDFEVLDSKNVCYRKQFLLDHGLKYDSDRVQYENGVAQDCDLGLQIQAAGGRAICNQKMLIWHKDPQNWKFFIQKNLISWRAHQSLALKWPLEPRAALKKPAQPLMALVDQLGEKLGLGLVGRLQLFLVAKQLLLLNRILPFFYWGKWL